MAEFVYPEQMEWVEVGPTFGRLAVEALERGYGTTLGSALRRVLLSSIPGASVVRVNFAGKYHEYETIPGMREDVLTVILNLKSLALRCSDEELHRLYLEASGQGDVFAGQIETPTGVEIMNPELKVATLTGDGQVEVEMEVETGLGFQDADENKREDAPVSLVPVDCDFSPVDRVNYVVEDTRVGGRSGYERLVLEVYTNGAITPQEAVSQAVEILRRHVDFLAGTSFAQPEVEEEVAKEDLTPLSELGLDQRACNLLREEGIVTLGDLVSRSREEILDIHGFGEKTLERVAERLAEMGIDMRSEKEE
ncbi:MAG: DNA-directed RNA polymerase subunit alpha [Candidatus Bipolaricaulota bacterium]